MIALLYLCWRVKHPLFSRFLFVGYNSLHEVEANGGYHAIQQSIEPGLNLHTHTHINSQPLMQFKLR